MKCEDGMSGTLSLALLSHVLPRSGAGQALQSWACVSAPHPEQGTGTPALLPRGSTLSLTPARAAIGDPPHRCWGCPPVCGQAAAPPGAKSFSKHSETSRAQLIAAGGYSTYMENRICVVSRFPIFVALMLRSIFKAH